MKSFDTQLEPEKTNQLPSLINYFFVIFSPSFDVSGLISSDEEALLENAQRPLKLIPITLDLDLDGFKYKDSFTWNFNGKRGGVKITLFDVQG